MVDYLGLADQDAIKCCKDGKQYPEEDAKASGALYPVQGKVKNDSRYEHLASPSNSYYYRACPESVDSLEKLINEQRQLSRQGKLVYFLFNSRERNCCGWACKMIEDAGFTAPFEEDAVLLALLLKENEDMEKVEHQRNKTK